MFDGPTIAISIAGIGILVAILLAFLGIIYQTRMLGAELRAEIRDHAARIDARMEALAAEFRAEMREYARRSEDAIRHNTDRIDAQSARIDTEIQSRYSGDDD